MYTETKNTYYCEYCGKSFLLREDCEAHEETHIRDYDNVPTEEIITILNNLADNVWSYHICGKVMGMPCSNMASLLETAAKRLGELESQK